MSDVKSGKTEQTKKELEIDGFKFELNPDLLDDVEAFELIDAIESEGRLVKVVPLMNFLIGKKKFDEMKKYFAEKDNEGHKESDYKPRLRVTKLADIYKVIIANFDPKA